MQFLYLGFSQRQNIRMYRFQSIIRPKRPAKTETKLEFLLTADMALLARYHVPVQDGPTLCLKILAAASSTADTDVIEFPMRTITAEDVSAFVSARDALKAAKLVRRKPRRPFKPSPSSQLKWPQMK